MLEGACGVCVGKRTYFGTYRPQPARSAPASVNPGPSAVATRSSSVSLENVKKKRPPRMAREVSNRLECLHLPRSGSLNKTDARYHGGIMSLERLMSKPVATVQMDDSLRVVKETFDNCRFHHLLVVESGQLFGVISDRDLLRALSPSIGTAAETAGDAALLNRRVHQIMTRKPITLAQDAGIFDAIEIFNKHNISCIPIVDDERKPVGIISWRDILKALSSLQGERPDKANQQGDS